ncbi:hypothetical protein [Oxynema aestuarii]|uniref:Uncharacterized protein n=1 Tax=Oxynema aestuarii AP17 TaxID=2064643 RepID=A0A6H1TXQ4_9CYAN|nr:hypothetical protein [Oxynema aestuarii]QIZ71382.1 hypothetical protein HCG48_12955 [Oxynema aestuarii AP17]
MCERGVRPRVRPWKFDLVESQIGSQLRGIPTPGDRASVEKLIQPNPNQQENL